MFVRNAALLESFCNLTIFRIYFSESQTNSLQLLMALLTICQKNYVSDAATSCKAFLKAKGVLVEGHTYNTYFVTIGY